MDLARSILILPLAALLLMPARARAATPDSVAVPYLFSGSPNALEVGCLGPCACPIVTHPISGSFVLAPAGSDPLFRYYEVQRFEAWIDDGPRTLPISGSGHYRIGGEVALAQELSLDLAIRGQPPQRFDSGLVPGGAGFPDVSISCAVHGFYCLDSVLVLRAKPELARVSEPRSGPSALRRVHPNPFRSGAEIEYRVGREASVELAVLDVAGRRVRTLAREPRMTVGDHHVAWDGRLEDGRTARAGLYWIRMTSPDGSDRRQLVKLE
jgi:hypothetical protein